MLYPGFLTMARFKDGSVQTASILRFVHPDHGAVSAVPVFSTESRAASPPDDIVGLRARNAAVGYEAWPIRDVYEACAMAHLVSESTSRPFLYLWDYESVVDCERVWQSDLLEDEAVENEDQFVVADEKVAELRDKAWGSQYEVASDVEMNVQRHGVLAGRMVLLMSTVREGQSMSENLVARYRGTPRNLQQHEAEEVLRACYEAEGVPLDEVQGPFQIDEHGHLLAWRRTVHMGPQRL